MIRALLVVMLCFTSAKVFAVDASSPPSRFSSATSGYTYAFPHDHGNHDQYQTEWWYFTGHVRGAEGRRFGYELTFFRRGIDSPDVWTNPSKWSMRHIYLAHFALTDEQTGKFLVAEKISRGGIGKAEAKADLLDVWIGRWRARATGSAPQRFHLQAQAEDFSIDFFLEPRKPPIIHGTNGVSYKGANSGETSHYYSLTRLHTTGAVRVNGMSMDVEGLSWMDHEFGSGELANNLVGWDWFSIQLNNEHEIMAYGLRHADGTFDPASSGTLVFPDGSSKNISFHDLEISVTQHWTSPVSQARYPNQWTLAVPNERIELELTPLMANQELATTQSTGVTYWEGAVDIMGVWKDQDVHGQGYVELTGYAESYTVKR